MKLKMICIKKVIIEKERRLEMTATEVLNELLNSKGALIEKAYAEYIGLNVLYEKEE